MRLERESLVAGVEPEFARQLARACHEGWAPTGHVAARVARSAIQAGGALRRLCHAGFLEHRPSTWADESDEWTTTVRGGALSMASFLKPIARKRAHALLEGVLERAESYNGDEAKPLTVTRIDVFGSYVDPTVDKLGDLDLAVTFEDRVPGWSTSSDALLGYSRSSGRRFPNFVAELAWPRTELLQMLRNRSGYVNVHTEDISRFTNIARQVFPR